MPGLELTPQATEKLEAQASRTGSPPLVPRRPTDATGARHELRRQIAQMERELAELFAATFPRRGIDWTIGAAGGPRLLGVAELERIRDRLAHRLADVRAEVARRADAEEANRGLVERMIADPAEHKWVRVSNQDVGEPGCRHWHSRPRWGLIGMLLGWWRVKLSSGCPLATGPAIAAGPECASEPG